MMQYSVGRRPIHQMFCVIILIKGVKLSCFQAARILTQHVMAHAQCKMFARSLKEN